MKSFQKASLTLCSLFALSGIAQSSDVPRGNISASAEVVKAGSRPNLDWNITYPETVADWVDIEDNGTIKCISSVNVQVRNLAADVQSKRTYYNGRRWVTSYTYIDVQCYGKISGQSWSELFNGTQPEVDPNSLLWNVNLKKNETMKFAGRTNKSGFDWWYSHQGTKNVVLLRRGDTPPSYSTWTTQSTLGEHISSYLDEDGKITIGPRDVIVAFELTHDIAYEQTLPEKDRKGDMQDLILLLSFQKN